MNVAFARRLPEACVKMHRWQWKAHCSGSVRSYLFLMLCDNWEDFVQVAKELVAADAHRTRLLVKRKREIWVFATEASVDGKAVATADIMCTQRVA